MKYIVVNKAIDLLDLPGLSLENNSLYNKYEIYNFIKLKANDIIDKFNTVIISSDFGHSLPIKTTKELFEIIYNSYKESSKEEVRKVVINLLEEDEVDSIFYKWKIYNNKDNEIVEYIVICNNEIEFEDYTNSVWKYIRKNAEIIEKRLMFRLERDI